MPDWKKLIRKHVVALRVCPASFGDELVNEWANHLEDSFEMFQNEGLSREDALGRSLDQIRQFSGIGSQLRILREALMRGFTKQVALPGVLTFALATAIGAALDFANIRPKTILFSDGLFLSLPLQLLSLLPLCGAIGAYLSHRNGGSALQRIAASMFLPAIMAVLFVATAVAGGIMSRLVPNYGWNASLVVRGLALWLTTYAILPAIPLLLGSAAEIKVSSMRTHPM
ncbi:MAG: hypothetical protein HY010_15075 [Acidobacteria bacterium]|nr:hypothetical protein [Acidobacteriota bacterium]